MEEGSSDDSKEQFVNRIPIATKQVAVNNRFISSLQKFNELNYSYSLEYKPVTQENVYFVVRVRQA